MIVICRVHAVYVIKRDATMEQSLLLHECVNLKANCVGSNEKHHKTRLTDGTIKFSPYKDTICITNLTVLWMHAYGRKGGRHFYNVIFFSSNEEQRLQYCNTEVHYVNRGKS